MFFYIRAVNVYWEDIDYKRRMGGGKQRKHREQPRKAFPRTEAGIRVTHLNSIPSVSLQTCLSTAKREKFTHSHSKDAPRDQ